MTGKQNAVMWIGLILIAANLVMKWSQIRDVIFSPSGLPVLDLPGQGVKDAAPNTGGFGFHLPSWIPTWPGTQIPLIADIQPQKTSTATKTVTLWLPLRNQPLSLVTTLW